MCICGIYFLFLIFLYKKIQKSKKTDLSNTNYITNKQETLHQKQNKTLLVRMTTAAQTQEIVTKFAALIDTELEYSRNDMAKILTTVYREVTNNKTKKVKKNVEGEEKKKRAPTAYNIFVKEKMAVVKEEFPELNRQDLMKKIAVLWSAEKEKQ